MAAPLHLKPHTRHLLIAYGITLALLAIPARVLAGLMSELLSL